MDNWLDRLEVDPLPPLLSSGDRALTFFVRRDLLGEDPGPVAELWTLPEAQKLFGKQQADGSWRYRGRGPAQYPYSNYDLLETFRNLRLLVGMYGLDRHHPAIQQAAAYVFSCQTEEGDIRGIIGNQYMPYYHGAIVELLVSAGYEDEPAIERAFTWLLSVRQDDGGWIVPMQAIPSKERTEEMWRGEPLPPQRAKPFSHMATGMVLRAFAAHPRYRHLEEARQAGGCLKGRFFQADKYNDRRAAHYWLKFQYPFWWQNLLTALDSLSWLGFLPDDADVQKGLAWFVANQEADGLWPTSYGSGKGAEAARRWVALAVCRVLRRNYEKEPEKR